MSELPIGQRESQSLEFEDAEVMRHPHRIAREVAAMLNSGGGTIWIGVPEVEGVAVPPSESDAIEAAESTREALLDLLIDRIEPCFDPKSVLVEVIPISSTHGVVRIDVRDTAGSNGRAFASIHDGCRAFDVRVQDRLRMMERRDLEDRIRGGTDAADPDPRPWLEAQRRSLPAGKALFAFAHERFDPRVPVDQASRQAWSDLIAPRREPWDGYGARNFLSAGFRSRPTSDERLTASMEWNDLWRIDGYIGGAVVVEAPTQSLIQSDGRPDVPDHKVLHPYALAGHVLTTLQLVSRFFESIALGGGTGWFDLALRLGAHPPLRRDTPLNWNAFKLDEAVDYAYGSEIWTDAIRVRLSVDDLVADPQGRAKHVLGRVYESFGFDRFAVPSELRPGPDPIRLI